MTTSRFPRIELPNIDADRIANIARDAAYVAVGAGVLAFQKLQVRRHELAKQFGDAVPTMADMTKAVEQSVAGFDDRLAALETKLDELVAQLKDRLPSPADDVVGQVHDVAKAARKQVRDLIGKAA